MGGFRPTIAVPPELACGIKEPTGQKPVEPPPGERDRAPTGPAVASVPRRTGKRIYHCVEVPRMDLQAGLPPKQGLYDPSREHDACGVAFVAHIKGRKS